VNVDAPAFDAPGLRLALRDRYGLVVGSVDDAFLRALVAELTARLAGPPLEVLLDALVDELPISESYLFRHPELWQWLDAHVWPGLVRRAFLEPVRVVSLGCASGQEAFTAAIALLDQFAAQGIDGVAAQGLARVTGVDASSARIAQARRGWLSSWAVQRGPRARLERRLLTQPEGALANDVVRALCTFVPGNLAERGSWLEDVASAQVVLLQNVLIYFEPSLVERVIDSIVARLRPGAWLVVGPTEAHLLERQGLEPSPVIGVGRAPGAQPSRPTTPPPRAQAPLAPWAALPPAAATGPARPPMLSRAVAADEGGNTAEALELARAACFQAPEDLVAHLTLGRLLRSSDGRSARQVLQRVLERATALGAAPVADSGLSAAQVAQAARALLAEDEP
jgi:chemotaxis methyl-accepting protein methylase